jgi:hypothetical protein
MDGAMRQGTENNALWTSSKKMMASVYSGCTVMDAILSQVSSEEYSPSKAFISPFYIILLTYKRREERMNVGLNC